MADKPINIQDHLSIRDFKKNEKDGKKIAKKLRQIFKGDISIIRNYQIQKQIACHFYGVNKLLTILDEFRDYFDSLSAENVATLPEPPLIKKINTKIASGIAQITVGNANLYLASAVMTIKPIQLIHIKEGVTPTIIRDQWLARSQSTVKPYILANWDNIVRVLKNRDITYDGRRLFISACYGNVSLSQKQGKQVGNLCSVPGCNRLFSTESAQYADDRDSRCHHCQLPLITGIAGTNKANDSPHNHEFMRCVAQFKNTVYYSNYGFDQ